MSVRGQRSTDRGEERSRRGGAEEDKQDRRQQEQGSAAREAAEVEPRAGAEGSREKNGRRRRAGTWNAESSSLPAWSKPQTRDTS